MDHAQLDQTVSQLVSDLLIILVVGLAAGVVCKRLGISLMIGYMIAGAVIGSGGFGFVTQEKHELEYLARLGALLLLFSIGMEFALEELLHLSRHLVIGGTVQMVLVAVPVAGACLVFEMSWKSALLIGLATSLSSTVLVFKGLAEWGQLGTPAGRRALAILLFQDIALVPLMLLVPLLTGQGGEQTGFGYLLLGLKSVAFVISVLAIRWFLRSWLILWFAKLRSTELLVLFGLSVLVGVCLAAELLGLPAAIGALAAGLILSGNRLTKQLDTIILPFRELFAAIFFVTLGALLQPKSFLVEPLLFNIILLVVIFLGILLIKTSAASVALRLTGLGWHASCRMGLGLSQLGEFSFVLLLLAYNARAINLTDYNRLLFVAIGTLLLTPQLLRFARGSGKVVLPEADVPGKSVAAERETIPKALVIGIGHIGRQVTSRLETVGVEVCLIDQSPVNLYPFAMAGFHTVSGNAVDAEVLLRAGIRDCSLAVVCVPDDSTTKQVVKSIRELNGGCGVVARCRYLQNIPSVAKAGAETIVCEEREAATAILSYCEKCVASNANRVSDAK